LSENVAREWIRSGMHLVEAPIDPTAEQRAEHRRLWELNEAARQATRERDARIAARVTKFVEAGPPASLDEMSPRGALLNHLAWLADARRLAAAAADRLAVINIAMSRRKDALASLEALDESTRAAFGRWVQFGSEEPRPPDRADERSRLNAIVAATEADAAVAELASFEDDVAVAICERLTEMIPPFQCAVLVEGATPISDRITDCLAELRECYAVLAALNEVTERGPTSFHVKLPPTPHCQVGFDVEASDAPLAISGWRKVLADLRADPKMAVVGVPGDAPRKRSGLKNLFCRSVSNDRPSRPS
jgi:hypothetical protein